VPLLRKATATRRGGKPAFKPTGLVPQKVVDVSAADLTGLNSPLRDTYQRKVFHDGTNFFVVYWEASVKQVKYVASIDGKTWTSPTVLMTFYVAPYYGGNADIGYPNKGALDPYGREFDFSIHWMGSNGANSVWMCMTISGQVLTNISGGTYSTNAGQGGSVVPNLGGVYEYMIFHRNSTTNQVRIHKSPIDSPDGDTSVTYGGTTTGGAQLLSYKTSSPYTMLALAKDSANKLYYNLVSQDGIFTNGFAEIATLGTGFSDFCACSEAQNIGDPERIHLVYIKSTGELCYRKFEKDAWSSEKVLVSSGASYPVIAVGSNGKLYVFYVKDEKIWVIHHDGSKWFSPVKLFPEHTYNNPAYLSTNQNVQSGKICLVWIEGTASPYEVWFCILED
jgi:hypothetical protein